MNVALILAFTGALCSALLAVLVAFRGRRDVPHTSFIAGMAVLAGESLCNGMAVGAGSLQERAHWQSLQLVAMSLLPGMWLLFSTSYARGNYREILSKWQVPFLALALGPVGLAILFYDDLIAFIGRAAPGAPWTVGLSSSGMGLYLLVLLAAVLVLMNLERTYRAAVGTMRWRIKFMVLGLGLLFASRAYTSSQAVLSHASDLAMEAVNSSALVVACGLMLRTLARAGHFEVHLYPSRSLLQNSFTVLLAGTYLIVVGVMAKLMMLLGADSSLELKGFLVLVAVAMLVLVLFSDRFRSSLKAFVSRHLQRPLHDYRSVWRTFSQRTARCVEQGSLCQEAARLMSEVFQTLSVSVWLIDKEKRRLTFAASTSLSATCGEEAKLAAADAGALIRALGEHPKPLDLELVKGDWAAGLRGLQPGEFANGGHRYCLPLMAGEDVMGVVVLGDRVGGTPFSLQDLELLKVLSDQTAARLLNLQLTETLSQAKQLEAFQAMSAFFVHDLKNTASTLSLMLQNFPAHYQDPEFREDALRGIARTVNHLNERIGRLTVLQHELKVEAVECDLNELVSRTLEGQELSAGLEISKELAPLPRVKIDPGQIGKVLTNLVLNAKEATGNHGQIRVETGRRNGWAMLSVGDTGCGMAPEFVRNRLFRPFQTTKQKGIGIGMFHCKMIVEAHRGRIEVESEPGKGTAFRVLLPI